MSFMDDLSDPVGLGAAVVLGVGAAEITAARATPSWLAIPVGLGVAVLVAVVNALLSRTPQPAAAATPWPSQHHRTLPKATSEVRDLLRRICLAAVEVRVGATTVHDADPVMAPTTRVVDVAYRLAALVARTDNTLPRAGIASVITALTVGAQRMEDVAGRIDGPAASRISVLVDDLGLVKRDLESAETAVRRGMSGAG
ncbi:hypothetical protein [Actinokineospora sp. HUAS TT18]|uniref:hypothetical protein n=1 Tax=Actinokineospora sp. HUAS TT18 TaxID=3447451 RepID=UPI003F51C464